MRTEENLKRYNGLDRGWIADNDAIDILLAATKQIEPGSCAQDHIYDAIQYIVDRDAYTRSQIRLFGLALCDTCREYHTPPACATT